MYTQETFDRLCEHNPPQAKRYAGLCRASARKRGKPAPDWAANDVPARAARAPTVATMIAAPAEAPAGPLVIPTELTAWRSASSTRGFSLSLDGRVQLIDWQGGPVEARFGSVADALAAVAADAVRWRATPRNIDPRHQRSNRAIGT